MASLQEQFVIDAKGKKTGVILSLRRYQKLLEDLHDLAIVAERRSEERIPLEEMKRRSVAFRKCLFRFPNLAERGVLQCQPGSATTN